MGLFAGRGRVCEQAGAACGSNSCAGVGTWMVCMEIGHALAMWVCGVRIVCAGLYAGVLCSAAGLSCVTYCSLLRSCVVPLPVCASLLPFALLPSECARPPVYIHGVSLCTLAARRFAAGRVWHWSIVFFAALCCAARVLCSRRQSVVAPRARQMCVASSTLFQQACVADHPPYRRVSVWCD